MQPGTVLHADLRSSAEGAGAPAGRPIKLLQWNIERGYQLPAIIAELQAIDADVISLQEVDVGNARSGFEDTGRVIAAALGLNYLFLCEFHELESPVREAHSQGGGLHGNAILSKFDFAGWRVVEHTRHPVDWDSPAHALAAREPRKGRRLVLAADVRTPQGPLTVYCCHLEVFCGILDRLWQFSDVMADIKQQTGRQQQEAQQQQAGRQQQQQEGRQQQEAQQQQEGRQQQQQAGRQQRSAAGVPVAVLGDLNTMANGVARLSPHYCCDHMRWRTLGCSEAQFWHRHVFAWQPTDGRANPYLLRQGLPAHVCQALVNSADAPLADPFHPVNDITLDNPAYRLLGWSLMTGKLDWALLRGMHVVAKSMGNDDYSASDHKWLLVEVQLAGQQGG